MEGLKWGPVGADPCWEDPEVRIPEDGGAGAGIPPEGPEGGDP